MAARWRARRAANGRMCARKLEHIRPAEVWLRETVCGAGGPKAERRRECCASSIEKGAQLRVWQKSRGGCAKRAPSTVSCFQSVASSEKQHKARAAPQRDARNRHNSGQRARPEQSNKKGAHSKAFWQPFPVFQYEKCCCLVVVVLLLIFPIANRLDWRLASRELNCELW